MPPRVRLGRTHGRSNTPRHEIQAGADLSPGATPLNKGAGNSPRSMNSARGSLEKLGEMQGGPPLFRHLRGSSASAAIVEYETTQPSLRTHRRVISWRAGLLRLRLAMT